MADITLNRFFDALEVAAPEAAVVFATEEGPVGAGYHITELKHANIDSIDCAGRQSRFEEVSVQVLDVVGDAPMPVERLRMILTQSLAAIPALADAPVHVEFGHRNVRLSRYEIAGLEVGKHLLTIKMFRAHATCKPAAQPAARGTVTSCCA